MDEINIRATEPPISERRNAGTKLGNYIFWTLILTIFVLASFLPLNLSYGGELGPLGGRGEGAIKYLFAYYSRILTLLPFFIPLVLLVFLMEIGLSKKGRFTLFRIPAFFTIIVFIYLLSMMSLTGPHTGGEAAAYLIAFIFWLLASIIAALIVFCINRNDKLRRKLLERGTQQKILRILSVIAIVFAIVKVVILFASYNFSERNIAAKNCFDRISDLPYTFGVITGVNYNKNSGISDIWISGYNALHFKAGISCSLSEKLAYPQSIDILIFSFDSLEKLNYGLETSTMREYEVAEKNFNGCLINKLYRSGDESNRVLYLWTNREENRVVEINTVSTEKCREFVEKTVINDLIARLGCS